MSAGFASHSLYCSKSVPILFDLLIIPANAPGVNFAWALSRLFASRAIVLLGESSQGRPQGSPPPHSTAPALTIISDTFNRSRTFFSFVLTSDLICAIIRIVDVEIVVNLRHHIK